MSRCLNLYWHRGVLQTCLRPISWRGYIETLIEPYVTADWQMRLRIQGSTLYDEEWKKGLLTGLLWDVTERFFLPKLKTLAFDLAPPRDAVLSLLKVAAPSSTAEQAKIVIDSATPKSVEVRDTGIVLSLALTVPDTLVKTRQPAPQLEAPLSPAELETFQQALERWDAFLVFIIKGLGDDLVDPRLRRELLDLLLKSRYEFLPILTGELSRSEGDPVRRLFVETWERLRSIVQEGGQRRLLGEKLLRYAAFINAGDALIALDQAAPGLGIEISADGLRRLARMIRPEVSTDPLIYDMDVDPELRRLFGFPAEALEPPAQPPPTPEPQSYFRLIPEAYAAAEGDADLGEIKKRLDKWLPNGSEYAEYSQIMQRLLGQTTQEALKVGKLDQRFQAVYRKLLPATAMKESCWRHYERKQDKITFLSSRVGAIGLMQINPRFWRGFYNVEKLKWDVAYNARAGAEILIQYLDQYGIEEADRTGNADNVARATYAVYNGGPRAVTRYRSRSTPPREKKVHKKFWDLYRGFASNGEANLQECNFQKDPAGSSL